MLKWFDAGAAEAQADRAVEEFLRLLPNGELADTAVGRKKQVAKLEKAINNHRQHYATARYNVYQKAKFANRVKWRLHDADYPADFVDALVRLLII